MADSKGRVGKLCLAKNTQKSMIAFQKDTGTTLKGLLPQLNLSIEINNDINGL